MMRGGPVRREPDSAQELSELLVPPEPLNPVVVRRDCIDRGRTKTDDALIPSHDHASHDLPPPIYDVIGRR
jgi:hypothetical protein